MEEDKYDDWFARECLPILNSNTGVCLKHLQRYVNDKYRDEEYHFADATLHYCVQSLGEISSTLIKAQDAPLSVRCKSMCFLLALSPLSYWVQGKVNLEIVDELLSLNDPDAVSKLEQIKLVEMLLWAPHHHIYRKNRKRIEATVRQMSQELGVDELVGSRTKSILQQQVGLIKANLRIRIETPPDGVDISEYM